jgi:hypothetical protein
MKNAADGAHIYVIGSVMNGLPCPPCKIGITANLASRLATIQTGNHQKLTLVSTFFIPDRVLANTVEAAAHEKFQEYRLNGEWFSVNPIDATIGCCIAFREALHLLCKDGTEDVSGMLAMSGATASIGRSYRFISHCKAKNIRLAGSRMVDGPLP